MLQDIETSIKQVLGCLLKSPNILNDNKYNMVLDDFPNNHQKIIYGCIYNQCKLGIKSSISVLQLKMYMKEFNSTWYDRYSKYDPNDSYLYELIECANEKDFEYHYNRVKKNSLLKELNLGGWDVSRIYDETGSDKELNFKFESSSIEEILESLMSFNNHLKKKWCSDLDEGSEMSSSSEGIRDLVAQFKKGQTFGIKLPNPVLNSIAKGARLGKVVLFGAGSGVGKTRISVMNACDIALPFKLNTEANKWECNGKYENTLIITTELLKEEVQSMMLSCVSKISETKLNYSFNELSSNERKNLEKSICLLEKFPIHICHLPNYDLNDLEIVIEEYVIKHNIRYIFFDYIHLTGKIMEQLKGVREDIIILQIMTACKNIANKYGCFFWIGSQLNRSVSDTNAKDTFAVFRSAFSIGDKVDIGLATMKATPQEVEDITKMLSSMSNFKKIKKPNLVTTVIKNRGGQTSLRMWINFNHSTLEEHVVAVTDLEGNPMSIDLFNQEDELISNSDEWLGWLNR